VWRRSSLAAFRSIGNGHNLRVSPPFNTSSLDIELLKKSKYAYFNLHGLADGPDWYGQKDINEDPLGPDFPIAISAQQLQIGGPSPEIIFSEACYGAYIKNKNGEYGWTLLGIGTYSVIDTFSINFRSAKYFVSCDVQTGTASAMSAEIILANSSDNAILPVISVFGIVSTTGLQFITFDVRRKIADSTMVELIAYTDITNCYVSMIKQYVIYPND